MVKIYMKELLTKQLAHVYPDSEIPKEIIIKSFKKCGINNAKKTIYL